MKITRDELNKMKDWHKLIFHPLVRPITDKIDTILKQRYGQDVQWLFDNYTEITFDVHFRIEEEDSCFEISNVDEEYDSIEVIIYQNRTMIKIPVAIEDILEK